MRVVLFEPEIPPNTGNIARLCAATGVTLDLIEPLGFKLENRYLKRAGLDYWEKLDLTEYKNYQDFMDRFAEIQFVQNYELFSDLTLQLVKEGNGKNLKDITFAPILANANKDRTDSIGAKAKEILECEKYTGWTK